MKKPILINTKNGEGRIDEMYISELGFLMIRVYYKTTNKSLNHNLGLHNPANNVFTNSINGEEEGAGDDDGARQGRRS